MWEKARIGALVPLLGGVIGGTLAAGIFHVVWLAQEAAEAQRMQEARQVSGYAGQGEHGEAGVGAGKQGLHHVLLP